MEGKADVRIRESISSMVLLFPLFASVALRWRRVADPTCPTMWTDGPRLGYNSEFVMAQSTSSLLGVLVHEALHVLSLHPWRMQGRDPIRWNIAADAVVNGIIEALPHYCGYYPPGKVLRLPEGGIPGVSGKSVEELYAEIPKSIAEGVQAGVISSSPTGEVRPATNPDGTAMTETERVRAEQEAAIMVQQAIGAAKRAGKLPAGLERYLRTEALTPRIPWREILTRFIADSVRDDYSFTRPNRRVLYSGIILPSLHSPGIGEVVLALDTSGSISPETLKQVCAEALGALSLYTTTGRGRELTVGWFDTEVYPQTVLHEDDLRPRGGGGTAYSPVMEWVKGYPRARSLIVVTDGECTDFGEAPSIPVLWILTKRNLTFSPPYGEVAYIMEEI